MSKKDSSKPIFEIEEATVLQEVDEALDTAIQYLDGGSSDKDEDSFHNTKKLLQQYRKVEYAIRISESDINLRMEMEHGTSLAEYKERAELAGIDLSGTKLENYTRSVVRSKNMLLVLKMALEALKLDPDRGELHYNVIYETYIVNPKPRNRAQIIDNLEKKGFEMSVSSYTGYLRSSIRALDRILWGYTARDCMEIIRQFIPESLS